MGKVNCTWARFNAAIKKVKDQKDVEARKQLARQIALPLRKELIAQVADVHRYLLATVTTNGAMGNVANWQQHVAPTLLTEPGQELAGFLGQNLPADAMPTSRYDGIPRIFLPTVRSSLVAGEPLRIKVIVLGVQPRDSAVYWRSLGKGDFARIPLDNVARGVYSVTLAPEQAKSDLEYYVQVKTGRGRALNFPATAPRINQTVVVFRP